MAFRLSVRWRLLGVAASASAVSLGLVHREEKSFVELEGSSGSGSAPTSSYDKSGGDLELRFVQVVFRHGARAPLTEKYGAHDHKWEYCHRAYTPVPIQVRGLEGKKRPFSGSDERQTKVVFDGGCRKGQLTHLGQVQALQLGAWLRERYHIQRDFLPGEYHATALKVRSTNISRTLDTVTGVLSGLYPNTEVPILVETCEDSKEWLYPNHKHCKRLQHLIAGKKRSMIQARRSSEREAVLEGKLRKAINTTIEKEGVVEEEENLSFTAMYDVSHSVKFHSNEHHQNMSDELLKELEIKAVESMKGYVAPEDNQEMVSLSIGKVLQDILQGMGHAASGKTARAKMQLFSGHDTTLMPILVALGYKLDHWPPFMSNVVFELYWSQSKKKHFVKIVYNQQVLKLEGADGQGFLEFSRFHQLLQKYISIDYTEHCNRKEPSKADTKEVMPSENVSGV